MSHIFFFFMRASLSRPLVIQHPWDLHKCRALAHVWLLGRVEWEQVPSSDVLMRRLRLTRCCGYMSVPPKLARIRRLSSFFSFFFGSFAEEADKRLPCTPARVHLILLFIFGLIFWRVQHIFLICTSSRIQKTEH